MQTCNMACCSVPVVSMSCSSSPGVSDGAPALWLNRQCLKVCVNSMPSHSVCTLWIPLFHPMKSVHCTVHSSLILESVHCTPAGSRQIWQATIHRGLNARLGISFGMFRSVFPSLLLSLPTTRNVASPLTPHHPQRRISSHS